jgi:hypothetical protein
LLTQQNLHPLRFYTIKFTSPRIADLLHHGLLRGSFVPPEPIRDLRDLTRYRAILSQETTAPSPDPGS